LGNFKRRYRAGERVRRQPRLIQHQAQHERLGRRELEVAERRAPLPLEEPRERGGVEVQAVIEHAVIMHRDD